MGKNHDKVSSLDRAILQAMGEGRVFGCDEDPAKSAWPELWQWLTRTYVGKDSIKQPATISISAVNGGFIARVNDRDLAVGVSVTVNNLQDCFAALEAALANPSTPISNWGKKEATLRKRKPGN